MHLLLIHQNFPGQFRDLAPAWLAAGHQVTAIGSTSERPQGPQWESFVFCGIALNMIKTLVVQRAMPWLRSADCCKTKAASRMW